jgi:hypothetical protein
VLPRGIRCAPGEWAGELVPTRRALSDPVLRETRLAVDVPLRETVSFLVSADTEVDPAALTSHPVLRCVNEERN